MLNGHYIPACCGGIDTEPTASESIDNPLGAFDIAMRQFLIDEIPLTVYASPLGANSRSVYSSEHNKITIPLKDNSLHIKINDDWKNINAKEIKFNIPELPDMVVDKVDNFDFRNAIGNISQNFTLYPKNSSLPKIWKQYINLYPNRLKNSNHIAAMISALNSAMLICKSHNVYYDKKLHKLLEILANPKLRDVLTLEDLKLLMERVAFLKVTESKEGEPLVRFQKEHAKHINRIYIHYPLKPMIATIVVCPKTSKRSDIIHFRDKKVDYDW